jgi:hypothetical protein
MALGIAQAHPREMEQLMDKDTPGLGTAGQQRAVQHNAPLADECSRVNFLASAQALGARAGLQAPSGGTQVGAEGYPDTPPVERRSAAGQQLTWAAGS